MNSRMGHIPRFPKLEVINKGIYSINQCEEGKNLGAFMLLKFFIIG
jgi:hypothetical protein